MIILLLILAFVVVLLAMIAFAARLEMPPLRCGVIGLMGGLIIGLLAGFLLTAGHRFGGFNVSLPAFTIADTAFTPLIWIPVLTAIVGMVAGVFVDLSRR